MEIYNDDYIESIRYVDPFCGGGIPYPALKGTRYYFGSCVNNFGGDFASHKTSSLHNGIASTLKRSGFSYIYLRNAKQHFEAPQHPVVNPNMINSRLKTLKCFNPKDCEAKGLFFTGFFNRDCSAANDYMAFNVSTSTCNRFENNLYESYRCIDKHTVETRLSQNSDCSKPFQSEFHGGTCGLTQKTTYCQDSHWVELH